MGSGSRYILGGMSLIIALERQQRIHGVFETLSYWRARIEYCECTGVFPLSC